MSTFCSKVVMLIAILGGAVKALGVQVTYTIDPTRSSITGDGSISYAGLLSAQLTGSDKSKYTGTVTVDLTPTTIQFIGGSVVDATEFHLATQPGRGGSSTPDLADYAFVGHHITLDYYYAFHDLVLDFTGPASTLVSGTTFNPPQTATFKGGTLDARGGAGTASNNLTGIDCPQLTIAQYFDNSLHSAGGIETLSFGAVFGLVSSSFQGVPYPGVFSMRFMGQMVATRAVPIVAEWKLPSGGDWNVASNWVGALVPNGAGATAILGQNMLVPGTISVNTAVSVGSLIFDNSHKYTVSGNNTLTLNAASGTAGINVVSGSHEIATPVIFTSPTDITVANAGDRLTISKTIAGAASVQKLGGGGLLLTGGGSIGGLNITSGAAHIGPSGLTVGGAFHVAAGATATLTANVLSVGNLDMPGSSVLLASGSDAILRTQSLSITGNGKLDVSDGAVIVDYSGTSVFTAVRTMIITGYDSGLWTGNGITSSAAAASTSPRMGLGYGEAWVALGPTGGSFSGQPVDGTTVLVKYTYCGDANLDGQVDISDLGVLATNWQAFSVWTSGDFDYSGFVDISDLGRLASNWQAGVGAPLSMSFEQALASVGFGSIAVPEPVTFGLLALSAFCLTRPHKRIA